MKVMLASPPDPKHPITFPKMASPKIDGYRAIILDGVAMSRKMIPIPNAYLQAWVRKNSFVLQSLDGELVVGEPFAADVYARTSALRRVEGEPDFTFYVFDRVLEPQFPYIERYKSLFNLELPGRCSPLLHFPIDTQAKMDEFEANCLETGYEGIMLRNPNALYKHGRATAISQDLLKIKRFEDAEAVVVSAFERMHNANEATRDALGHTKRSTHQENLRGLDTLGGFVARGINGRWKGVEFRVTGFTATQASSLWSERDTLPGLVFTYKYLDVGSKDKPRHPIFRRWRPDAS